MISSNGLWCQKLYFSSFIIIIIFCTSFHLIQFLLPSSPHKSYLLPKSPYNPHSIPFAHTWRLNFCLLLCFALLVIVVKPPCEHYSMILTCLCVNCDCESVSFVFLALVLDPRLLTFVQLKARFGMRLFWDPLVLFLTIFVTVLSVAGCDEFVCLGILCWYWPVECWFGLVAVNLV